MPAPRGGDPSVPYDKVPLMRLSLHQMRTHFPSWTGRQRLAVFNKIYHAQLLDAGFPEGRLESHDKLDSQYRESRKEKNLEKWQGIIAAPDDLSDDDFKTYQVLYSILKMNARELGFPTKSVGNYSDDDESDDGEEGQDVGGEADDVPKGPLEPNRTTHVEEGASHEAIRFELPDAWSGSGARALVVFKANGAPNGGEVSQIPEKKSTSGRKKTPGKGKKIN